MLQIVSSKSGPKVMRVLPIGSQTTANLKSVPQMANEATTNLNAVLDKIEAEASSAAPNARNLSFYVEAADFYLERMEHLRIVDVADKIRSERYNQLKQRYGL